MLKRFLADSPPSPHVAVRGERGLLALIVVLAETLRLLGIRLGLPFVHHWDEVLVTQSAHGMIERGDNLPSNYFYGAPLTRLVVFAYRIAHALKLAGSQTQPPGEELYLRAIGRPIAATIACSGTIAVYLAGRMIFRRGNVALWGALLYAVGAELIWHARYLVTDASVVALTAWTIALAALYVEKRSLVSAALAVLASALAFSFKLTGLGTMIIPTTVLVIYPPRVIFTEKFPSKWFPFAQRALLVFAVPIVLAIFLATNPHVLEDWRRSFFDWEGIARHYREGHVKPFCEREPGIRHLLAAMWFVGAEALSTNVVFALVLTSIALVGLVMGTREAKVVIVISIVHAMSVLVAMAWPNRAFLVRMYLPALPILCIGFGRGMVALIEQFSRRIQLPNGLQVALATMLAIGLSLPALHDSIACQLGSHDPRERAIDDVAMHAQALGHNVTMVMTTTVDGPTELGSHPSIRHMLARPGVTMLSDVRDARSAIASNADFIVVASYRDMAHIWPYEEAWPFREVDGYIEVARFDVNCYEERLDLVPTWDGYVSAIVLQRAVKLASISDEGRARD